jgi:putative chitinase
MFLKEDSRGPAVVRLQKQLKKFGFNPGKIDGDFGPATKAAVIAFQKSRGLLADGIAGPRTLTALELAKSDTLPSALPAATVTVVSKIFPFTPVDNIRLNLPYVLRALRKESLGDKPLVLMAWRQFARERNVLSPSVSKNQNTTHRPAPILMICMTSERIWAIISEGMGIATRAAASFS